MLAIDRLTRAEKLELAHALWRDLEADAAPLETSPWHGAALDEAQQSAGYRELSCSSRGTPAKVGKTN